MARSVETVTEQIDALRDAMAQGVRVVSYDGRSVEYRSIREMRMALVELNRELADLNGDPIPSGRRFACFGRGY